MATSKLAVKPTATPISLAEAKAHLRVEHDDQDALILALVEAATEHVQDAIERLLITQTWEASYDAFPDYEIPLSPGPVQSVESIKYDAEDGYEETIAPELYAVDTNGTTAWLYSQSEAAWPASMFAVNAVRIRYVAGYGAPADVPAPIRHAIRLLVGHWYANAEQASEKKTESIPYGVDALVKPYRVFA